MPKCPFCKKHELNGEDLQEHISYKHPEEATDLSASIRTQARRSRSKNKNPPIVVDGNNIAYYGDDTPQVSKIKKARAMILRDGYKPIIYVSSALRYDIDDSMELNRLINLSWIIEVEGGQDDDELIIEEANRKKCKIVSNDNFSEYLGTYRSKDWNLSRNIVNFSFVDGKFKLV